MWSFLTGVVGLSVLELVVTNAGASDRVAGIMALPAAVVRWFVDPSVAGISPRVSSGAAPAAAAGTPPAWRPDPRPNTKSGTKVLSGNGTPVHSGATSPSGNTGPGI